MQFYRQRPVGDFIVDFYSPKTKLVIEVDGSQHFNADHLVADKQRDAALQQRGLTVLRFDNLQVLTETESVMEVILEAVEAAL